jgi:hypothetical protein
MGADPIHMIEAVPAEGLTPSVRSKSLLLVHALLHGTRFFGGARAICPGCSTCAGSAGIAAGRRWSASARGAHGAVLCAFGRAGSNIALARRTAGGLGGLREGGGCCECKDAG